MCIRDSYYRLMVELGINLEDQETTDETKLSSNENVNVDEIKYASIDDNSKLTDDDTKDEDVDESIESVPFISEPVKKKRARSQK